MMEKSPRGDRYGSRMDSPSFSSSLLDRIYRSIDESGGHGDAAKMKKHQWDLGAAGDRSCMVENVVVCRRSVAADLERSRVPKGTDSVFFKQSYSGSSDSSWLSSSESDSLYGRSRSSHSPPATRNFVEGIRPPKPIRTNYVERCKRSPPIQSVDTVQKPNGKQEPGNFPRTKSKALKIYSDLKKVKQPTSPGGKLASFLNSLFTARNTKKLMKKTKNGTSSTAVTSEQALSSSTCSSASSFSRSCLNKTTPSSTEKSKRSVRFCPVSVILNDDCDYEELENRRLIDAAKELLRNYQKKRYEFENPDCTIINNSTINNNDNNNHCEDEEEEEDDDVSCASSDLFELDNLSAIGIERYREELPVYETTRLGTNRAHR